MPVRENNVGMCLEVVWHSNVPDIGNWRVNRIHVAFGNDKDRKNNLITICYRTLWWIWKAGCNRVLKNIQDSPTKVAGVCLD